MNLKSQSAMEYLMTYGWTILVISIVIVTMFSFGLFNTSGSAGTGSCVALSGFECTQPLLYSTGALVAGFGQIGRNIAITGTACTTNESLSGAVFQPVAPIIINSGQITELGFQCPVASSASPLGSHFNGYLWINYTTVGGTGTATTLIGTVRAVVTASGSPLQPDIIVQYSNGLILDYNVIPENQWSVGNSLTAVVANEVNGESIYLKSETYNLGSSSIDLGSANGGPVYGIKLYGAGKYATVIVANSAYVAFGGTNSLTSDLTLKCDPSSWPTFYCIPWDLYTSVSNVTLRNAYLNGLTDGIYASGGTMTGINAYNITINSAWDTLVFTPSSGSQFNVIDSSIISVANPNVASQDYADGITGGTGTMDIVNTFISSSNGIYRTYGVYSSSAGTVINIFGGKITTSAPSGTVYDLQNYQGTIAINATTSYTTKSGTISNTLGTYGPYTYLRHPVAPPGNWIPG